MNSQWQNYHIQNCSCRIGATLPDDTIVIAGVDDCPVHGLLSKHGGKREGAGRPPKYDEPMRQISIRLPPDWLERLREKYGSVQAGVETLVREHLELY